MRYTAPVLARFAAIYFIWGSTFLAIKVVVGSWPPFLVAGVRATIAGALLYSWTRVRGAPAPKGHQWREAVWAGALFFLGGHGALFWASRRLPSGLAAVLDSTIPIWVAVFGRFGPTRAPLGRRTIAGLVLGFAGIVWLDLPASGAGVATLPSIVLLVGAACWGLGTVGYRDPRRPDSPALSAALPMLTGGALLLTVSIGAGELARVSVSSTDGRSLLALIYLIGFGSLVAFSAYTWLLGVVPATTVASYAYVNPVIALLLGWLLAGEELPVSALPPVLIIILSIALIVTGGRMRLADDAEMTGPVPASPARTSLACELESTGGTR